MLRNNIWVPLESNPESLYLYSCKLGQTKLAFQDIYGFDAELLDMIQQPVHAIILLYPLKEGMVDTHFIVFVEIDGRLVELDGRKDHPVIHCTTNPASFKYDTGNVIKKKFIEKCQDDNRFSALAVVASDVV
ncbi:ubiquitin carboxyl-terminal hydrolase [Plasmodium inui San Antonio 1]|uniref:Ubiquitin carboxyl-terminal hydrolase n=1 Tax=Plasmodium inui San Antonio 1 TaxID=1237626 RepID=W7AV74_9APIC|nr:ubiquitin carboxyl-terminal hydrolase [Plasmodium inui San Antonio 1]EUD69316.1 ubiquitin carboxyl-terminal hydrolase [Plasmodium inui San Antonio 1]